MLCISSEGSLGDSVQGSFEEQSKAGVHGTCKEGSGATEQARLCKVLMGPSKGL